MTITIEITRRSGNLSEPKDVITMNFQQQYRTTLNSESFENGLRIELFDLNNIATADRFRSYLVNESISFIQQLSSINCVVDARGIIEEKRIANIETLIDLLKTDDSLKWFNGKIVCICTSIRNPLVYEFKANLQS